ncbi:MAG: hypothetical protein S4CHLAM7_05020 [Chlamydiae bacterium]|nr:hypothetical protein [Chlamydiota bacterium]
MGLLSAYVFFKFDANYLLKLTADAYEKQDYSKASSILTRLKKKPSSKVSLYDGYLQRAQNNQKQSSQSFLSAYENTTNPVLKKEASFNLLLNAYLQQDFKFIQGHLKKDLLNEDYSQFFQALVLYQDKDYAKAYASFVEAQNRTSYSKWMEKTWNTYFPKASEIGHIAHCLIEIGKPHQGRVLLEKHLKKFEDKDQTLSLLLGISYLLEGENTSLDAAQTYLEKASSYLDKSACKKFQHKISQALPNYLNLFLQNSSYIDLGKLAALTRKLELSENEIIDRITEKLRENSSSDSETFYTAINQLAPYASDLLEEKLYELSLGHTKALLTNKDLTTLKNNWSILKEISQLKMNGEEALFQLLQTQLITLMENEDTTLEEMHHFLLFWDPLERDETKRFTFITNVMPTIKELWLTNPTKAFTIAQYLDQLTYLGQRPNLQKEMLEIISELSQELSPKDLEAAYLYFNPLLSN